MFERRIMQKDNAPTLYPKLKAFMGEAWMKYFIRNGGMARVKDFAIACGVSDTNMGRYIAGTQMPSPAAQDKIALVVGPGIYVACDAPMRMPKDPLLAKIAQDWADLSKDEKRALQDEARDYAERRRKNEKFAGKIAPAAE